MTDPLDRLIAEAARTIEAETGSATACTLHRDGRVTGGLKYAEGRLVALREIQRALAAGDPVEPIRSRWQDEHDRRRAADLPSPPWVSYATGGLEAVTEVLEGS